MEGAASHLRELSEEDGEDIYDLLQDIPSENGFLNEMYGADRQTFRAWLSRRAANSRGERLEPGFVPSSVHWLFVDGRPVAMGKLRHHLNETLLRQGGHIGYAVRLSERGRGHGHRILRGMLSVARDRGIDRVLLTCGEGNVRSRRIIETAGGVLEDIRDDRCRYWIAIDPARTGCGPRAS